MEVETQHKHNGEKKKIKKGKKSKCAGGSLSMKQPIPDGERKVKKKKDKQKSKEHNKDTTEISLILDAVLAPYISDGGSFTSKKSKKKKVLDKGVDRRNKTDIGGSTSNENSPRREKNPVREPVEFSNLLIVHPDPYDIKSAKKKNKKQEKSKKVKNSSSRNGQRDVSSKQDSCASTSKRSDEPAKPVRKYRPAEEVLNIDDLTEEQRKANEYVLSGKYLPTVSECLNNEYGDGKRPFVPTFKGDPICPYCHKAFVKNFWRDHHVRSVHLKIKKHKCNWCGQRFSETETLKGHEYIHMDAKPFPCRFCDKVYRYSSHMMRCRRSHMKRWSVVLDGMESKRRKRKQGKASDSKEEEDEDLKDSSEESAEESDLVGKLINGQSEVFNDIKESFCVK